MGTNVRSHLAGCAAQLARQCGACAKWHAVWRAPAAFAWPPASHFPLFFNAPRVVLDGVAQCNAFWGGHVTAKAHACAHGGACARGGACAHGGAHG
eukprot:360261-Chlamydomonas_euryale.AAC.1